MPGKDGNLGPGIRFRFAYPVYIRANHHFPLHAHLYHELVVVQLGRFRSRACGEEYIAGRGDILLYTAGTQHEEWAEDEASVVTWVCAFDAEGLSPQEPVLRRDAHGKVQKLMEQLCEIYLYELDTKRERCSLEGPPILQAMLAELRQLMPSGHETIVERVRSFVRANLATPLTVEDLAAAADLSKYHFARLYHEATGRTPIQDVQYLRSEEARHLILTTTLPLHAIAPMVGISNEYHLSRLLKKHLGIGVRQLRRSKSS